MSDIALKLAALWVAVMLTYLLGDVLRIYAGDVKPGAINGVAMTEVTWLAVAVVMAIPIVMLVVTMLIDRPIARWANLIAAVGMFAFNAIGLPTYPGAYDKLLIVVGLVFNVMTFWIAWSWE